MVKLREKHSNAGIKVFRSRRSGICYETNLYSLNVALSVERGPFHDTSYTTALCVPFFHFYFWDLKDS